MYILSSNMCSASGRDGQKFKCIVDTCTWCHQRASSLITRIMQRWRLVEAFRSKVECTTQD